MGPASQPSFDGLRLGIVGDGNVRFYGRRRFCSSRLYGRFFVRSQAAPKLRAGNWRAVGSERALSRWEVDLCNGPRTPVSRVSQIKALWA